MSTNRRTYDREFREGALRILLESGRRVFLGVLSNRGVLARHGGVGGGRRPPNGRGSPLQPADGYAEELRLQALIAAEHARATTAAATDWAAITDHYAALEVLARSPVVRLNRAIAVAEARGAHAGLRLLTGLDAAIPGNHRVAAIRAELARRAGDLQLSRLSYHTAIELCANEVEKTYLRNQLTSLPYRD